ncbi:hypothetical protein GCM10018966_040410 [Streptomyces yanii]
MLPSHHASRRDATDGWCLTGDLVRRDADGWYRFVGRADDVIRSAGHLIGRFEAESALMEHPAVAEAGGIGRADPVAGNIVKAFVPLNPGVEPTPHEQLLSGCASRCAQLVTVASPPVARCGGAGQTWCTALRCPGRESCVTTFDAQADGDLGRRVQSVLHRTVRHHFVQGLLPLPG